MCQMVARDTFLISLRYLQNVVMVASIYTTVVVALERWDMTFFTHTNRNKMVQK